jgi:hypothetical protein
MRQAAASICGIFPDAGAPPDAQIKHIPTNAVHAAEVVQKLSSNRH